MAAMKRPVLALVTTCVLAAPAGVAAAHPDYHWQIVDAGDLRAAGPFALAFSGGHHATIHRSIPIVDNVGLVVTAPGEPTFFHPGDSYGTTPEDIDVLALPLGLRAGANGSSRVRAASHGSRRPGCERHGI